nr:hypothetical protein 1 [bacterium]
MKPKKPTYIIEYENKDVTKAIAPYVMSLSYTDNKHGKSDEIQLEIRDDEGLWKSSWYPQKGDIVKLKIGYEGEQLVNCGSFEIDEPEFSDSNDEVLQLKGVSASIKKPVRQENTKSYENRTLRQIAQEIADKHEYTLVFDSAKDLKISLVNQKNEGDLEFLKRLAEKYGYAFKITGNNLVFYELGKLEETESIYVFAKKDLLGYKLQDKSLEVYRVCEVKYFDARTKELISYTETDPNITKGDTLKLNIRCENKEQAIAVAKAALSFCTKDIEGSIEIEGNQFICAGANIEITELGKLNGKYSVETAKHRIEDDYTMSLNIKKIGVVENV